MCLILDNEQTNKLIETAKSTNGKIKAWKIYSKWEEALRSPFFGFRIVGPGKVVSDREHFLHTKKDVEDTRGNLNRGIHVFLDIDEARSEMEAMMRDAGERGSNAQLVLVEVEADIDNLAGAGFYSYQERRGPYKNAVFLKVTITEAEWERVMKCADSPSSPL